VQTLEVVGLLLEDLAIEGFGIRETPAALEREGLLEGGRR